MSRPTIQIDTSGINRILRNLPGNRDRLVRRIAFEVEARAKQKAPVDTGALRASIYTRTGRLDAPPPIVTDAERGRPAPEEGVAHVEYRSLPGASTSRTPPAIPGAGVAEVRANLQQYHDFRRLAEGR